MKRTANWAGGALAFLFCTTLIAADTAPADKASGKFTLRYRFQPGQTLRWDVLQQSVMTGVASASNGRNTQTTESASRSTKAWRIKEVDAQGVATFEHVVEDADMKQTLSTRFEGGVLTDKGGRPLLDKHGQQIKAPPKDSSQTARYNSKTDKKAPAGFETMAAAVGPVLSVVRMDPQGKIISRQRSSVQGAAQGDGQMTIPLPAEPIEIGHVWSYNYDIDVALPNQTSRKIQLQQKYTLRDVKTGLATIGVRTSVLTPVDHPLLESQLIQTESSGVVKFDIDAGRVIEQQIDADKRVVGFRGAGSALHYLNRFTEKLLPERIETAQRSAPPSQAK